MSEERLLETPLSVADLRAKVDEAQVALFAAEEAEKEASTEFKVNNAKDIETGSITQTINKIPYPYKHWIASKSLGKRIVYTAVLEPVRGGLACRRYDISEEVY